MAKSLLPGKVPDTLVPMALFHRKEQEYSMTPLYTLGMERSLILIGLGNKGKKYDMTRHNAGFMAVDHFAAANEFPGWTEKPGMKCWISRKIINDSQVILVKPATMMNLSGEAALAVMQFYKVPLENVTVVHDELDIQFGQIRTRTGGGSAGHNGIKSIANTAGKDFHRVRIGIAGSKPEQMESSDYVLAKFSKKEQEHLPIMLREVTSLLTEYVYSGNFPVETRSFIV